MKILITTDTYYPMINGVVISTDYLYRELKKSGNDVRILTLSSTGEERVDGDIYYLKSFSVNIYPGLRAKNPFSFRFVKEIVDWGPDIIHSQTEFSAMLISKRIAKKLAIPHIHTYHTMYEDYLKYVFNGKLISRRMANRIVKILLNSLDGVIVPTGKVKDALIRYGVVKDIFTIPTGVDISRFKRRISDAEKESILSKYNLFGKRVLVYIGRIAEEKNIEEIIRYYSSVAKEESDIALLIVGGGPYLEKLTDLVKELELGESIKFTGMVEPEEVHKYYQVGQAFVTASTSETQGLTYIEALASGTPVICKYDSCIKDLIINYKDGFTFNNEEEFHRAVDTVFSNEEALKSMAQEALEKAEEYSLEAFGKSVSRAYFETLSKACDEKGNAWQITGLKIFSSIRKEK